MENKSPPWFASLDIPERLKGRLLANFTPHRDGWVRWYRGRTVFVCGKRTPVEEVEDRWHKKRHEVDKELAGEPATSDPRDITVKALAGMFIARQRRRVETGRPKPLSRFTLEDYISTLEDFAKTVGVDAVVGELTPDDFQRYSEKFDKKAAASYGRKVAYIRAMFAWGAASRISPPAHHGPDFRRPPQQSIRDERLSKVKSYTPAEIRTIYAVAKESEKLWIAMALNGALDNSDISGLTSEVLDMEEMLLDYRRRKQGKVRRVIPLRAEVVKMLKAYRRPAAIDPASNDRVFLTPTGHPLVRMVPSQKDPGRASPVDFIASSWSKLLQRAGLRPKSKRRTVTGEDGIVRRKLDWKSNGDGRGFRGLRTTFANLIPPGYAEERQIIMGHSHGTTFLESYLEKVGTARLRKLVDLVWKQVFTSSLRRGRSPRAKKGAAVSSE